MEKLIPYFSQISSQFTFAEEGTPALVSCIKLNTFTQGCCCKELIFFALLVDLVDQRDCTHFVHLVACDLGPVSPVGSVEAGEPLTIRVPGNTKKTLEHILNQNWDIWL